jgi:hypothetical protein
VKPSNGIEHAWLDEEPPRLYPSLHHPSGAERRFNEDETRELVVRWQASREPALLDQILKQATPLLTGTILGKSGYTSDFEETLNSLRLKLWRKLPKFDPVRGRCFYLYLADRESGSRRAVGQTEPARTPVPRG